MSRVTSRGILGAAALVAAACGGDAPAPDDGAPRVFGDADVRDFASSDALAHVVDMEVLPDGRIWLFNSAPPFFVGFGPDGTLLAQHGTPGEGAREFRRPVGLVDGGLHGEAWAVDEIRHALIRVSRPDSAWAEIALPADSLPPASLMGGDDRSFTWVRAARLEGAVVLPRTTLGGDGSFPGMWRSMWGGDLVAVDSVGSSARTVVSLREVLGDPGVDADYGMELPPMPMWFRLWTVCGGEIRVVDRLRNQVRRFDGGGVEMPADTLPEPPFTEVSDDEFARAMLEVAAFEAAGAIELEPPAVDTATLLPAIYPRIRGDGAELAEVLPRYTALHCGDDGALWIRRFDRDSGGLRGGPTWLRIDPSGALREVRFPERFDPYEFTGDRIWGIRRDALDVPSVAWVGW